MSGAGFFDLVRPGDLRAGHAPLYVGLRNALRGLIAAGALRPGDGVPGERELAERLSVSRVTVRRALAALVAEGAVTVRRGSGAFVAAPPPARIEQPLSRLTSFSEDMARRGRVAGAVWLDRSVGICAPDEAMALGLSPQDRVARLHRLRTADGQPMAVERAAVPAMILPEPDAVGASLYAAMAARGMAPLRALQRLSARSLPEREALHLGVAPGAPAIYIARISRAGGGEAVEFTRSWYRADAYDFVAELTLAPRPDAPCQEGSAP